MLADPTVILRYHLNDILRMKGVSRVRRYCRGAAHGTAPSKVEQRRYFFAFGTIAI